MRKVSILVGILVVLTTLCGALGAITYIRNDPAVTQPIAMNHQAHVRKFQIKCVQCHVGAESAARATIPNIEVCGQVCHRPDMPALTKSPEEIKLRKYLESGERIPWKKVYRVDSHVYFSHARHTALAQLSCEMCHGNVGDMTTPVERQAEVITMERCMVCHERYRVSNDCNTCHR
jgi:hypothetical protein